MKLTRLAGLLAVALTVGSTSVYAAGMYGDFPVVGGAAFCYSTVGTNAQAGNTGQGAGAAGSNGTYCAQTVPAGPPALTGLEILPLDTGLQNGANPQTAVIPSTWLNAGYYQLVTTGTAVTVAPGTKNVILNLGAATMAVTLPAAPYDDQIVTISNSSSTAVSTFSVVANSGQSLVAGAAPTALAAQAANTAATAQSEVAYLYRAANTSWYRLH